MRWLDLKEHGLALYCRGEVSQRYLVLQALDGHRPPSQEQAEALGFELQDGSFILPGTQISLNTVKAVFPKATVREMTQQELCGPEATSAPVDRSEPVERATDAGTGQVQPQSLTRAEFIDRAIAVHGQGGWQVELHGIPVEVPGDIAELSSRTQPKTIAGRLHEAIVLAADQADPKSMRLDVLADYPDISWRGSMTRGRQHSVNVTKLVSRLGIASKLISEFEGPEQSGACVVHNPPYQRLAIELLPYSNPKFEGKALYLTHYRDDGQADGEMVYGVAMGRLWLAETAVNFGRELRGCDAQFANMFSRNLLGQGFDKLGKVTVDFPRESRAQAMKAYAEHPEMFSRDRAEDDEPEPQLKPAF